MRQRDNESVGTMLTNLEGGWEGDAAAAKANAPAPGPPRTASDALRAAIQPEPSAAASPPPPAASTTNTGASGSSRPPGPVTRATVRMLRPEIPNGSLASLTPATPAADAPPSALPPVTVHPVVDVGAMPAPAGPLPRTTTQMSTLAVPAKQSSSMPPPVEPPTTPPTTQPTGNPRRDLGSTTLVIATPASIVPAAPSREVVADGAPPRPQAMVPVRDERWNASGPVPPPRPSLPPSPGPLDARLVMVSEPDSARAVAFRLLRDNLLSKGVPRLLAVAGTTTGDGVTTCAVNLALALAEHPSSRVLLVDGNFAAPALAKIFSMDGFTPPSPTADALVPLKLAALMQRFHVAAIVRRNGEAAPRFDKIRFQRILEHLGTLGYDHIVIDAGPLRSGAAGGSLVTTAEATLLAVRAGRTTARALRHASGQIPPGRAIGVTLVDDEPHE